VGRFLPLEAGSIVAGNQPPFVGRASQRNVRFLVAMQDRGRFSQWPHCKKTSLSTAEASAAGI
jgi:hypothetical protein